MSLLFKFAVVAIVLAVLVHPLVESIDTWDGVGPSNDSELTVVALVIALGLVLTLRRLIVLTMSLLDVSAVFLDSSDDPECATLPHSLTAFSEFGSPPLLPLRI